VTAALTSSLDLILTDRYRSTSCSYRRLIWLLIMASSCLGLISPNSLVSSLCRAVVSPSSGKGFAGSSPLRGGW